MIVAMRRFGGRAALVIGGGHGIGRAIAERLAGEGASVTVADLDADAVGAVAESLAGAGHPALGVPCDITRDDGPAAAAAAAAGRFGRLDVLVVAAGGDQAHPEFAETGNDVWYAMLEVNLVGVARCIRAALGYLLQAPSGGAVVTIGSVNGMTSFGSEPYSAAKAGLQNLTMNLSTQYGPRHKADGGPMPAADRLAGGERAEADRSCGSTGSASPPRCTAPALRSTSVSRLWSAPTWSR